MLRPLYGFWLTGNPSAFLDSWHPFNFIASWQLPTIHRLWLTALGFGSQPGGREFNCLCRILFSPPCVCLRQEQTTSTNTNNISKVESTHRSREEHGEHSFTTHQGGPGHPPDLNSGPGVNTATSASGRAALLANRLRGGLRPVYRLAHAGQKP